MIVSGLIIGAIFYLRRLNTYYTHKILNFMKKFLNTN